MNDSIGNHLFYFGGTTMDLLIGVISVVLAGILGAELDNGFWTIGHYICTAVLFSLVIWGIALVATPKSISHHSTYKIHTIETQDGITQIYFSTKGKPHNITKKFGCVFPEGAVLRRTHYQNWHLGCYCVGGSTPQEIWIPSEDGKMIKFEEGSIDE